MNDRTCSVEGCDSKPRGQGYCGMHYARWKRTGDPGPAGRKNFPLPETCTVEGCNTIPRAKGLCVKHLSRLERHGDVNANPFKPRGKCAVIGCDRPHAAQGYCSRHYWMWWQHGEPEPGSYHFAHKKIYRLRGKAADYPCEHCGGRAREWAYDHQDPAERRLPSGMPFSVDPWHYLALCTKCHKALDAWRCNACGAHRGQPPAPRH